MSTFKISCHYKLYERGETYAFNVKIDVICLKIYYAQPQRLPKNTHE